MVPVFKPQNEVELALAESELQAHGIPYYVHNRNFGGLYPGVQIDHYNARTIMVPEEAADDAREVLADFIEPIKPDPAVEEPPVSGWHKLRMLAEALVGWLVPPSDRRR